MTFLRFINDQFVSLWFWSKLQLLNSINGGSKRPHYPFSFLNKEPLLPFYVQNFQHGEGEMAIEIGNKQKLSLLETKFRPPTKTQEWTW